MEPSPPKSAAPSPSAPLRAVRPERRRRAAGQLGTAVAGVVALAACEDAVTEADCQRLRVAVERLWRAEVAAQGDAGDYQTVARDQGGRLAEGIVSRCRASALGKARAADDLACVERAQSLEELEGCVAR